MSRPYSSRRGSALLTAIIFVTLLGVICGGYLRMVSTEARTAKRASLFDAALNAAEGGIEEAIWALNNDDWSTWTQPATGQYRKIMSTLTLAGNDQIQMAVHAFNINAGRPTIVAQGTASKAGRFDMAQQLEVVLEPRSYFANGLIARRQLTFSGGNARVDSYVSADGAYDPYFNRFDRGTAGSPSVDVGAVVISNAEVYGFVATGGADPDVGPNGKIYGADTPAGTDVDPSRITRDFKADFPPVEAPSMPGAVTGLSSGGTTTIGTPGTVYEEYHLTNYNVSNSDTLVIDGPVRMVLDGSLTVKGEIIITSNGSLELYVEGDIDVGGTGIVNQTNQPDDLVIFGTNTTPGASEFKLHGNGIMYAGVYAPFNEISLKGGGNSGEMFGSVIGDTIHITGNYEFHYDETLKEYGGATYKMASWRVLKDRSEWVDFSS